jgi:hypothetical protein
MREILRARLRVENERMRDQILGREVGLPARLPELLEIAALGEAENAFDDRAEDRLRQDLLVGAIPLGRQIVRQASGASKLLKDRGIVVDRAFERYQAWVQDTFQPCHEPVFLL